MSNGEGTDGPAFYDVSATPSQMPSHPSQKTPPRAFVDKGRKRSPAEQERYERIWSQAHDPAHISAATVREYSAQSGRPETSWTGAAIALLSVGLLLLALGLIVLFTTKNVFVGILGAAMITSGMAWIGSFLGSRARR